MKIIKAIDLKRNYKRKSSTQNSPATVHVLHGLNFEIEEHEFVCIMGKSGCGKTTLLKLLGLIDKPTDGQLLFMEEDSKNLRGDDLAFILRKKIGFVYQDFYLLDSLSVKENIMVPLILDQEERKIMEEKALRYAEQFEIDHVINKYPYELSGGEKQRAAICRSLINDPDLILADEPTGNLDSKSSRNVIQSLSEINKSLNKTVVMVTHDPETASYCNRLIFLKDGLIHMDIKRTGTREAFYKDILNALEY